MRLAVSGVPHSSNTTPSYSACAMPCASPPCTCPRTSIGFKIRATVVHAHVAREPRVPPSRVDLDDGHVRAERVRDSRWKDCLSAARPGGMPSGSFEGSEAARRAPPRCARLGHAGDPDPSVHRDRQVGLVHLEQLRPRVPGPSRRPRRPPRHRRSSTCSDREPHVPSPRATSARVRVHDPHRARRARRGLPATSCANAVSWPCPCERRADPTVTRPSASTATAPELLRRSRSARRTCSPRCPAAAGRRGPGVSACSARSVLVARQPQRLVERALVLPDVVGASRGLSNGKASGGHEVAPAHLDRIHPELGRDEVHRALDGAPSPPGARPRGKPATGVVFVTTERPARRPLGMRYTPGDISPVVGGR